MTMVNLTINGKQVQAPQGATILEAARAAGIHIPTLCYHPELRPEGACRLCMVEASGARTLVASCVYPVSEGMVVNTNTNKVREARKMVVELLLANHPKDCLSCQKSGGCELQKIAADLGMRKIRFEVAKEKLIPSIAAIRPLYVTKKNVSFAVVAFVCAVTFKV